MATYESYMMEVIAGRKSRFALDEDSSPTWTARSGSFPIVIGHINSATYPVATVEVASGVITFKHGATYATIAADDTEWTSGEVDSTASATNTYGELVDAINASTYWRAYLLDGYRSQTCALKNLSVANDTTSLASQTSGVGLLQNLSGATDEMWCGLRNVDLRATFPFAAVNNGTMDTGFGQLLYGVQISINATGSPVFIIKDLDDANGTEDVLYQPAVLTDNTATAFNFESLEGAPLVVAPGHRILVGADISTITTQSYISVQGSVYHPPY